MITYILGQKNANEMLSYADNTSLLKGHYYGDRHYASLPQDMTITLVYRNYEGGKEFGQVLPNGHIQSVGFTHELQYVFPHHEDRQKIITEWVD